MNFHGLSSCEVCAFHFYLIILCETGFMNRNDEQVTFLPLLNEPCSFDLLIYTNKTAVVPKKWEDSDPQYIMNSQEVKLRSFTTSVSLNRACLNSCHSPLSFLKARCITSFVHISFTKWIQWSPTRKQTSGNFDFDATR